MTTFNFIDSSEFMHLLDVIKHPRAYLARRRIERNIKPNIHAEATYEAKQSAIKSLLQRAANYREAGEIGQAMVCIEAAQILGYEPTEAESDLLWLQPARKLTDAPVGIQTAAVYGDANIAELEAQHRDWMDEKRTQENARY